MPRAPLITCPPHAVSSDHVSSSACWEASREQDICLPWLVYFLIVLKRRVLGWTALLKALVKAPEVVKGVTPLSPPSNHKAVNTVLPNMTRALGFHGFGELRPVLESPRVDREAGQSMVKALHKVCVWSFRLGVRG